MQLEPIIPFEPKKGDQIPVKDDWLAQIKWDGVRILTYFDGHQTRLFNRKKRERTRTYPELIDVKRYCAADSVILDGEVIALGHDGKPSFQTVMKRDGIRRMDRVSQMVSHVPVIYMIFDVIFVNGQWIHQRPLQERMDILSDIVNPQEDVQLVPSHHDGETLFEVVKQQGMEGIVAKKKDSTYDIGQKKDSWLKIKNYQDVYAVIGGFTTRSGTINALLLGLYDREGNLWYVGHAGTGKLSRADWQALTDVLKPLQTGERPFINRPERFRDAVWIEPRVTARIQFMNWTHNRTLRQPSIQAFVAVPPEECTLDQ
ncbi:MAG: DNA ligase [Bacillaceae bacterium]|nr:DNA ligase [Bacillaceae bacterium]